MIQAAVFKITVGLPPFSILLEVSDKVVLYPRIYSFLCVEILGNAIRNHNQIKGICVLGTECKLSQYADDTTLILDGSDNSVRQSFSLLDSFATISGLRINYEKQKLFGSALHVCKEE